MKVFDEDAIVFASRKTAVLSGDVRKAFQTCRSAAEMVLARFKEGSKQNNTSQELPLVRIPDVQRVSREASDSADTKAVALSTPFEALLIVTLASLGRCTGRERKGFDVEEILAKMESIAGALGEKQYTPAPSLPELLFLLNRLAEVRFRWL
jgi:Cdc6-like AAA superfamily ATPase